VKRTFSSPLADRIVSFIAFKRMQGHTYAGGELVLQRFDAFLSRADGSEGPLDMPMIERYRATLASLSPRTQAGILSVLRQFSLYLHALEPRSVIVPVNLVRRQPRPIRFYALSPSHVSRLMAAAQTLGGPEGILADCLRFLIGLLYSTGLRISEATALNVADVDLEQATVFVRKGKFRKERLVPMSPSTAQAVREWLARRAPYVSEERAAPVLVVGWDRRLTRRRAAHLFRRLCTHCGLIGTPPPRLHDLRHNYACRRIALWREAEVDVNAMLPVLANAMGHVDFFATQAYLHIDAAALQQAAAKFHAHIHPCQESRT
jgi:integrase